MKKIIIRIQTWIALKKIKKNGWTPNMSSEELMDLMRDRH